MTTYALSFLPHFPEVITVLMYAAEAISQLEITLLAIFNIYRTAVIVRQVLTTHFCHLIFLSSMFSSAQ